MTLKTYLGDGVSVDFDGFNIVLSTTDGRTTTNSVYMNEDVLVAFEAWLEKLKQLGADPHDGVPPSFSCE